MVYYRDIGEHYSLTRLGMNGFPVNSFIKELQYLVRNELPLELKKFYKDII